VLLTPPVLPARRRQDLGKHQDWGRLNRPCPAHHLCARPEEPPTPEVPPRYAVPPCCLTCRKKIGKHQSRDWLIRQFRRRLKYHSCRRVHRRAQEGSCLNRPGSARRRYSRCAGLPIGAIDILLALLTALPIHSAYEPGLAVAVVRARGRPLTHRRLDLAMMQLCPFGQSADAWQARGRCPKCTQKSRRNRC